MKIEWVRYFLIFQVIKLIFSQDAKGVKPRPSTVHGWLTKMRGTILGDERMRNRGISEMRAARTYRAHKRAKAAQRKSSTKSLLHRKTASLVSDFLGTKATSPRLRPSKRSTFSSQKSSRTRNPDNSRNRSAKKSSTSPPTYRRTSHKPHPFVAARRYRR